MYETLYFMRGNDKAIKTLTIDDGNRERGHPVMKLLIDREMMGVIVGSVTGALQFVENNSD